MPRFVSGCPFCEDGSYKYWHHEGCPSEYNEYIDSDGYVSCDCGKKWHLVNMRFYCSKHSGMESLAKKEQFKYLLYKMRRIDSINDDFLIKLQHNVMAKWKDTN